MAVAVPTVDATTRLGVAGDVMLGRLVAEKLRVTGPEYVWGGLLPLLRSLDAFCINLECALTRRAEKWLDGYERPFHFRAEPGTVATLRAGRVDFASVANNHVGDFGPDGLRDTVAALDGAGIAHAGAGGDLAAARAPAHLTCRNLRVSLLAAADYPDTWAATESSPGMHFIPVPADERSFAPVAEAIGRAARESDLVLFSMHWGPNMRERPAPAFRRFAHRVIDAGASVFWGHSAHIVQGIEWCDGAVILYDTGDFVDDYAVDPVRRNDLSALFIVEAEAHRVTGLTLVPVRIDHLQAHRATGADQDWLTRRLNRLCAEFGSRVAVEGDGVLRVVAATPGSRVGGSRTGTSYRTD